MARLWKLLTLVLAAGLPMAAQSQSVATAPADKYALADRIFADYVLDAHIPGLVYGIVIDGQLVHVGACGSTHRPRTMCRSCVPGSTRQTTRRRSGSATC